MGYDLSFVSDEALLHQILGRIFQCHKGNRVEGPATGIIMPGERFVSDVPVCIEHLILNGPKPNYLLVFLFLNRPLFPLWAHCIPYSLWAFIYTKIFSHTVMYFNKTRLKVLYLTLLFIHQCNVIWIFFFF